MGKYYVVCRNIAVWFFVYTCFNRYSCKVIWLKVMTTNNDPNVILLPYLLAVLHGNGKIIIKVCGQIWLISFLGCPSIVRSDYGTENSILAACHMALRHNHEDEFSGEQSFRFGSSTTNTVELIIMIYTLCNTYVWSFMQYTYVAVLCIRYSRICMKPVLKMCCLANRSC